MYRIRGFLFTLLILAALGGGTFLAYRLDQHQRQSKGLPQLLPTPETIVNPPVVREPVEPTPPPPARVAVESEPVVDRPTTAVAPELEMGELRGRVTDASGRALAGVTVLVRPVEDGAFRLPEHPAPADASPPAEVLTDAEGRFRLTWPAGHPARLAARASGFAPAPATIAYAGEERTLRLAAGFELFGTVTRPDGAALGGARVRRLHAEEPLALAPTTRTDAAGRYSLRLDDRPGSVLEVLPERGAPSDWIELPAGNEPLRRVDVVVDEGWVVEGVVRDAESTLPVPQATVSSGSPLADLRTTTADSGGNFRLAGFGGAAGRLRASAPGYAEVVLSRIPHPADGAARVELVLERARAVSGRVVDAAGAVVPGARVAAVASRPGPNGAREQCLTARTGSDGRFRIDGLARDLEHALLLSRPGYASSVYDLPALERATLEHDVGDLVLTPPARLSGRVHGPDGAGLAGIEVRLTGSNHDRARLQEEGDVPCAGERVDVRAVRSDAQGRFWFVDVPGGSFRLATRRDGLAPSPGLALEVGTGEERSDLELILDTRGFLAGRVLDPDQQPVASALVFARPTALENPAAVAQLAPVQGRTDAEGRFSLTGLPAGEYTLQAQPDAAATGAEAWLPGRLTGVRTGSEGLELAIARGARIAGRLTDSTGRALSGWLVSTPLEDGSGLRSSTTDEEGRFELLVAPGTPCELEVRGVPGTPSFQRVQLRRSGVTPGSAALELQLPAPGSDGG